jgi:hypothetical protein
MLARDRDVRVPQSPARRVNPKLIADPAAEFFS